MDFNFNIKVYKQYFNFSASHFLIFADGTREPLHGHNYRVQVKASSASLKHDMVFDFLDIKPMVRQACDSLDHKLLLPCNNPHLNIENCGDSLNLTTSLGDKFTIPKSDVLILPIPNTSAERLAAYLAKIIADKIYEKFHFRFEEMEIEVEETPGQSASYLWTGEENYGLHGS